MGEENGRVKAIEVKKNMGNRIKSTIIKECRKRDDKFKSKNDRIRMRIFVWENVNELNEDENENEGIIIKVCET